MSDIQVNGLQQYLSIRKRLSDEIESILSVKALDATKTLR